MATTADAWLVVLGVVLMFFDLLMGAITGLDLFVLGFSLLGAGIVQLVTGDWQYGLLSAVGIMIAYWFFFRAQVKQPALVLLQRIGIDVLVGKTGLVVTRISPRSAGKVLIEGMVWQGVSQSIVSEGRYIEVYKLRNGVLEVSPV